MKKFSDRPVAHIKTYGLPAKYVAELADIVNCREAITMQFGYNEHEYLDELNKVCDS